jgi:hypothetical protein
MKPAKQYKVGRSRISVILEVIFYAASVFAFAWMINLTFCEESQEVAQEFAFSEAWASEKARLEERKLTRSK